MSTFISSRNTPINLTDSKWLLPVAFALSILMVACTAYVLPREQQTALWTTFGMTWFIACLLEYINHHYQFTERWTTTHAALYGFGVSALTLAHPAGWELLAIPALACAILCTCHDNHTSMTSHDACCAMMCISGASIVFPPVLLYIPLFLEGTRVLCTHTHYILRGLVIGLCMPYWMLTGYASLTGDFTSVTGPFTRFASMEWLRYETFADPATLVAYGIVTCITLTTSCTFWCCKSPMTHAVRQSHRFLILLSYATLVFMTVLPKWLYVWIQLELVSSVFLWVYQLQWTRQRVWLILTTVEGISLLVLSTINIWKII